NYVRAARALAPEIVSILTRLRRESWVDPDRVVLLGISAGGFGVLAAGASNPPGVTGVISFAGGRGSDRADHVCQPERLVAAMHTMGSSARLPTLWIYAQNDHFFGPALAAQMRDAYARGGSRA